MGRAISLGVAPKKHAAYEPVPLEVSVDAPPPDQSQANLVCQMLALDERLLTTYLEDLRSESPASRRKAARGLAKLEYIEQKAITNLREVSQNDPDRKVREAASFALRHFTKEEA